MELKFGVDDRPKFGALLLYGLQWFMICIPVVITSTFVAPEGQTILFTQKLFAIMGITMIVQTFWGHRLPLIAGPAAVLLMGVISTTAQGYDSSVIYPSMIFGAILVALISISGILSKIGTIFTPRVVISIFFLISFTISKPIVGLLFGDTAHSGLALIFVFCCTILMAVANNIFKGIWKTMVVILAMIFGAIIYYSCTAFPDNFLTDSVVGSIFVGYNIDLGIVLSFLFCYIALLINEVGSIQSLGKFVEATDMNSRQRRGTCITGIINIVASAMGVLGPVDYSLSPGIVASTSCASRYSVLPAAILMVILGFCPYLVSILLTIPTPVMGTVLLYLMATQVAAGFNMVGGTKAVVTFRDGMVIGIPIMFNIILTYAPIQAINTIPALIRPIVGNGFVMGIVIILVLEHLFLKERR